MEFIRIDIGKLKHAIFIITKDGRKILVEPTFFENNEKI